MHGIDVPLLKIPLKWRFGPLENYDFWNSHYGGFFRPCRDLYADDVTHQARRALRRTFGRLATTKRNRMLMKTTGMPRIGFLSAVFPDAKFIHVIRDGRAVAHSRMNAVFWRGWDGRLLWPGELPRSYRSEWEQFDFSFVALAGIEWKANMDLYEAAKRDNPNVRILEVRYEAFCAEPLAEVRRIADFAELPWSPLFERTIRDFYISSENAKWTKNLTDRQQQILNDVLRPYLIKYGYELAGRLEQPSRVFPSSIQPHSRM
jgi:hypothetical protein